MWWVLWTGWNDGVWNMAVDEWLMSTAAQRPPTLRIYGWRKPTVSLGRNERWQRVVSPTRLRERGVHLVRRPTGGRAVLHHRELTYSVTGSPTEQRELGTRLEETLARVSEALALGLKDLGADVRAVKRNHPLPRNEGLCFESATRYELVAAGRKLLGSAQLRTPDAFLQHGSLPFYPTLGDLRALAPELPGGRPERVEGGEPLPWTDRSLDGLVWVMAEAFARRFRSPIEQMPWNRLDRDAVRRLAAVRYSRAEWTYRR